jgi:mRNA-degrading endonuclease RelE of RelBE toxin-antitoxin system
MLPKEFTSFQFAQAFTEAYTRLPRRIQRKVDRQLHYLARDITHPGLRVRKMIHMNGIWEARVDHRYRLTFELLDGKIYLRTVGRHDIYQRP